MIKPDWPAPAHIHACCTTRSGGVSSGGFNSLNLAQHVNDDAQAVKQNRQRLTAQLKLRHQPDWLQQTHSTRVVELDTESTRDADSAISRSSDHIAVVLTADCLPVLITNQQGTMVAAVHVGWRGLLNGVLEATIKKMKQSPDQLLCWLGPAISQQHFEVGAEVEQAFVSHSIDSARHFEAGRSGRFQADLYGLARDRLRQSGVAQIYGGDYCSYGDESLFFSYRRETDCGRMASLIWIAPDN